MRRADDIDKKIDHLLGLAHAQFGIKTQRLDVAMRRIGRQVPSFVQKQAEVLVIAQQTAGHPKLMQQIDAWRVEKAFKVVQAGLMNEDRADRRRGAILSLLGSLCFNLISVCALILAVLLWRELI